MAVNTPADVSLTNSNSNCSSPSHGNFLEVTAYTGTYDQPVATPACTDLVTCVNTAYMPYASDFPPDRVLGRTVSNSQELNIVLDELEHAADSGPHIYCAWARFIINLAVPGTYVLDNEYRLWTHVCIQVRHAR